jgi:hypothetical protein
MQVTKINVRFVKPKGYHEPLAVFMGKNSGRYYNNNAGVHLRTSYQHTGQHGECTDGFVRVKKATAEQYAPLLKELESIGYSVTVK